MKWELVALDIDGTLVSRDLVISEANKKVISQIMAEGVKVTLATGRMYKATIPFALELNLSLPLILYQGSIIRTIDGKTDLFVRHLPFQTAREILLLVEKKYGFHVNLYLDDRLYVKEINDRVRSYQHYCRIEAYEAGVLSEFLKKSPIKLVVMAEPEELDVLQAELIHTYGNNLYCTRSFSTYLELAHPEASKGKALKFLADYLGIAMEKVIAIGDSFNDVDMFETAGLGVAMGNAPDEVKQKAHYVTSEVNEDGVSLVLKKCFPVRLKEEV